MAMSVSSGNNWTWSGTSGLSFTATGSTLFVWAQSTSIAAAMCALMVNESSGVTEKSAACYFRGDTVGDPIQFRWVSPSGNSATPNSAGYSANTWVAMGARSNAASGAGAASVFKDGTKTNGTATGTLQTFSVTKLGLGANVHPSVSEELSGVLAAAAFWTVALTDDEMVSLAKGFSPRRIRPQSLGFYVPLIRGAVSLTNPFAFTQNGSPTAADHPRFYGR